MSWKLVRLNRIVRIAYLSTPWRPTTQSISTADSLCCSVRQLLKSS
ncbi:MAG: hypothetical protein V8S24_16295 [Gordonibacter pamelaeae]